jgi:hypothetical protein
MKDDGSKEMAKAKEVAQRKMGELATSHMAKQMGVADPFERNIGRASTGGGSGGSSGAAELKSITNPRAMKSGGKVSSASSRADGCATKGKTKGRFV